MSDHNTVKFKLNPDQLVLSTQQREELAELAAMTDAQIDYSDIARSTKPVQWTRPRALVLTGLEAVSYSATTRAPRPATGAI